MNESELERSEAGFTMRREERSRQNLLMDVTTAHLQATVIVQATARGWLVRARLREVQQLLHLSDIAQDVARRLARLTLFIKETEEESMSQHQSPRY